LFAPDLFLPFLHFLRELLPTKALVELNLQIQQQSAKNRRGLDTNLLYQAIELSHYAAAKKMFELGIILTEVRRCSFFVPSKALQRGQEVVGDAIPYLLRFCVSVSP
jgi:hypothetical protein